MKWCCTCQPKTCHFINIINIYFSSKDGRPRAIAQVQLNVITYHYCVTNHDAMDDLFSHNQDCYMDIDRTFSILCGEVGEQQFSHLFPEMFERISIEL